MQPAPRRTPPRPASTRSSANTTPTRWSASRRARAQLAQRRNAALRGDVQPRPAFGLRHAGFAFAAVFAVAVGIDLMPSTETPAPAPTPQVAATTPATSNTILDEDPDFYAWLASTEVQQLAME